MRNIYIRWGAALLALSLAAGGAGAATLSQTFLNEFAANELYLWMDDPDTALVREVRLGSGMTEWAVQSVSGAAVVLNGPRLNPGAGRFTLDFDYLSRPFSLQWAEVFFESGARHVLGAGTLTYTTGGWGDSDLFTRGLDIPYQLSAPAPVPLPQSAALLLSALVLLPLRRRPQGCRRRV